MIIRALDENHDWTFGQGKNNYLRNNDAIAQDIDTRLLMFLGDCYFDLGAGINWWDFLGSKDEVGLQLAVATTILNTSNVIGMQRLSTNLDPTTRRLSLTYVVQTTYSVLTQSSQYDLVGA